MRVLLVSGIFYPDVGGPATHVRKIAEYCAAHGHTITIVTFGEKTNEELPYKVVRVSRKTPKSFSWGLYTLRVFLEAFRHDVIYAFDLTTAGIPSALCARTLRKPFIIRIGGDPIWEREVESGRRFLPMKEYYDQRLYVRDRPFLYRALRSVTSSADRIVVYSDMFKDFYARYFGVSPDCITVIKNPLLPRETHRPETGHRTFIFAGRFVAYKNLARVIAAAAKVFPNHVNARLLFVGDGPEETSLKELAATHNVALEIRPKTDQATLFELIRSSSVALAPALTEFNPNFILEAVSLGKPALISRGNGLSVSLPEYLQFDPMSDVSLARAMEAMLEDVKYQTAISMIALINDTWTWADVLRAHEALLNTFN